MHALIYGDSLTRGLDVEQEVFHIESRSGYTTQNFVDEEEQQIGLSMLLNEDHYDHLVLIMGTNDPQDCEADLKESFSHIQALLHVALTHPHRPRFFTVSMTMMNPGLNAELRNLPNEVRVWRFMDGLEFKSGLIHYDEVHLNFKGKHIAGRDLSRYLESMHDD